MMGKSSLIAIPDVSRGPSYSSSHRVPFVSDSNPNVVQRKLSISSEYEQTYPALLLELYHLRSDSKASNVLAFMQNAAKKEIADLVTVILPALQRFSDNLAEDSEHAVDLASLGTWWNTFVRFLFFVAETDDDLVRMTTERVAKIAKRIGDFKLFNAMHRRRKSLGDRYSFTMEVIFRAADSALQTYTSDPSSVGVTRTVKKLGVASRFMLDTMELSRSIVTEAESMYDLQFSRLEYSVVESLYTFARSEISVFICLCARWLEDDKLVRYWIQKHCGIRGRLYGDRWWKSYAEGRGKFVSDLTARLSSL